MIHNILPQYESSVLSIKLSNKGEADKLIWLHHKSGQYITENLVITHVAIEDSISVKPTRPEHTLHWILDVWTLCTATEA